MLTRRELHQIGPASDFEAEFGERLNLVTGDNGSPISPPFPSQHHERKHH
jgi:hypothetical protein